MTLLQLISTAFPRRATVHEDRLELAPDELVEVVKSDSDDEAFDKLLESADIPDRAVPEGAKEQWDTLVEFDRSTFDDAAYKNYQENFFNR